MSRETKGTFHNRGNNNTAVVVSAAAATTAVAVLSTAVGYYYYYHYYCRKHDTLHSSVTTTENENTEKNTSIYGSIHNDESVLQSSSSPPPIQMIDTTINKSNTTRSTGSNENYPHSLSSSQQQQRRILSHHTITIVHGSMTGTCSKFAKQMYNDIQQHVIQQQTEGLSPLLSLNKIHVQMGCIQDFDWWDELINEDDEENDGENVNRVTTTSSTTTLNTVATSTLIILLPTYTNGTFTPNSMNLYDALEEIQTDWRISKQPLQDKLQVAVFGSGSSEYNDPTTTTTTNSNLNLEPSTDIQNGNMTTNSIITTNNMGQPAKIAIRAFHKLGAKVMTKLMIGDDAIGDHMDTTFQQWYINVRKELFDATSKKKLSQRDRPHKQFSILPNTTISTSAATNKATNHNDVTSSTICGCHSNNNHNNTSNNESCCQNDVPSDTIPVSNNCNCSSNGANVAATTVDHDYGCCSTKMTNNQSHTSTTTTNPPTDEVDHNKEENENYDYDDDDDDDEEEDDDEFDDDDENGNAEPAVMDLEDIGDAINQAALETKTNEPREMVTPSQAIALKKEGYKLIGTHSAVKLCRWTKHQLRGRGGCYKHTFYGITSYQCMEATPSLACANKCVFCWRHHKNPVGKEWRWKTDDPYYIVDEAVQTHIHMIKETRGIPGVQLDRWKEAHTVRHCALSLVGEPIMYPRIDELLGELHRRKISTFLVTNGQHPTAIGSIRPITQLYVSVDAPTEQSLIAIDRPLFQDAWDRLRLSLSSLKDKGQRTVARLTVVKGWNSDEISGYAELIALGQVSLVEVKGVTFCGKSDASNLNMTNTPWHHEVVDLTRTLMDELNRMRQSDPKIPEYDLACEHKHSCSVLLARVDQFATEGYDTITGQRKWRTWIDYDKFHALAAKHQEDPTCTFSVVDYTAPTPDWAIFGAKEEGFDPTDRRHRKQTKYPKYTQFDTDGIPTHDDNHQELPVSERQRLRSMMEEKKRQIGDGSTVTELRGGEKEVLDASLMFRGLVVAK